MSFLFVNTFLTNYKLLDWFSEDTIEGKLMNIACYTYYFLFLSNHLSLLCVQAMDLSKDKPAKVFSLGHPLFPVDSECQENCFFCVLALQGLHTGPVWLLVAPRPLLMSLFFVLLLPAWQMLVCNATDKETTSHSHSHAGRQGHSRMKHHFRLFFQVIGDSELHGAAVTTFDAQRRQ